MNVHVIRVLSIVVIPTPFYNTFVFLNNFSSILSMRCPMAFTKEKNHVRIYSRALTE